MDINEIVYNSKKSLANKLVQSDGTVTDLTGAPVSSMTKAYEYKSSLPNKFLNPDGSYSTLNEILASMINVDNEIFIIVDGLPDIGEFNKIYLTPNSKNSMDEYFWNTTKNAWDKIGELDVSNLATKNEVNSLRSQLEANIQTSVNTSSTNTDVKLEEFKGTVQTMINTTVTDTLGGEY